MDIERYNNYKEDHCWQYDIRLKNLQQDIVESGFSESESELSKLRTSDFEYKVVTEKSERNDMTEFIKRHEWLGTLSQFTTHWFGAYYKGILAGVILFNVPNTFSKLLGDNTKELERLISRGACISWSPKNLASSLLMYCIKWMVHNTRYRLFTAYSDPTAKELGTIYQACNFYYLGKKAGAKKRYVNPYTGKLVSDRFFRQKTAYRKFAGEIGIEWDMNWQHKTGMLWDNMPDEIELKIRAASKLKQKESNYIEVPSKHKYAYLLGVNKTETKALKKIFLERNRVYGFPKER